MLDQSESCEYNGHEQQPLLDDNSRSRSSETPDHEDHIRNGRIVLYFCVSHFLSTWNSRFFEFGSVLFLASIFPHTLLPVSVYALARAISAIIFSPAVGSWVDKTNRLVVVRASIIGERFATAISCGVLLGLKIRGGQWAAVDRGLFAIIVVLAAVEKLCAIMNSVSVTRDWAVEITEHNEDKRRELNAKIRRIDLSCKLLAPFVVATIDQFSTVAAIITTMAMTMLSVVTEYLFIKRVYDMVPKLHKLSSKKLVVAEEHEDPNEQLADDVAGQREVRSSLLASLHSIFPWSSIPLYVKHAAFLPSLAYAFLHLTVLSFSGRMIAFLLAKNYGSLNVGLARSVSTVAELSATWIAPRITKSLGVVGCGAFSISWQTVSLTAGVSCFLFAGDWALTGLICGVVLSRIGLWGVDLSVMNIVQDEVADGSRGAFSTTEAMVQNIFELMSYTTTIIFARPEEFQWPILASMISQYLGCTTFWIYVCKRKRST